MDDDYNASTRRFDETIDEENSGDSTNYPPDMTSISNYIDSNISAIEYVDSEDEKRTILIENEYETMETDEEDDEEMDTEVLCQRMDNIHVPRKHLQQKKRETKNEEKKFISLSDFIIGKPMGAGQFGRVYLAKTREEHFICCLKMISIKKLNSHKYHKQLEIEVTLQQRLNHPNILQLYNWFQDKNNVVLILECALHGSMSNDMRNEEKKFYDDKKACKYTVQVADALMYCHSLNIIHRDLKTENILLDHYKNAKLCDFGWSIQTVKNRATFCGTAEYIPPEMLIENEKVSYGKEVDIWALGILIFEMLSGETPFCCTSTKAILARVREGRFHMPCDIDSDAKDLIRRLLKRNPTRRLELRNVLKHPWIMKHYSGNTTIDDESV
uniref:Aurora kinase n=1 Tax=Strongyloides papillosus TaxID=174720 RepID=A0A0N5BTL7_STREA